MRFLGFKILVLTLGWLLPVAGFSAGSTEMLTWNSCVKIANDQNPQLVSATKLIQNKKALYYNSFNSILPSLALGYSWSNSYLNANAWQQQLQGTISEDIFNWKDYAGIQLAAASLTEAQCEWQLSSAQVRNQLRRAFYQLLFAQEQIGLLERIQKIRLANSRMVELEYNSGHESKGNMLITRADLASAQADLLQAQRDLRVAQQALNHALGREETERLAVQGEFYLPVSPNWEETGSRLPNTPQIRRANALVEESRASLQMAWGSVLPNVSANYSRGWVGSDFFPHNQQWNASVNLSWPIFAGGPTATYFSMAAAQDQLAKTEADRQADAQQLSAAAESAWSSLMQSIDQVAVQKQYLEASKQRNDEATIEYSNGLLTFENWNQVVTSFVTYDKQYLSSRLNAVLAENDWENAFATALSE